MKLVISSYNKNEESITLFDLDLEKKTYQKLDYDKLTAPSYVISIGKYIYTYSKEPITMVSYEIANDKFIKIDEYKLPGSTLTHLCYSEKNNKLFAASYADGSLLKLDVNNGKFSNLKYMKQINDERDSKVHCVTLNDDESLLLTVNISLDELFIYDFDLNLVKTIKLPKGIGPRHAKWIGNYIYIITEYSNELLIVDYNEGIVLDRKSTICRDVTSYGGTLNITSDNKYIYCANRGEETIAKFLICNNKLEYIESFSCGGEHPRHMELLNDDLLGIVNKNSGNIVLIDLKDNKIIFDIPYKNVSGINLIK